MTSPMNENEYPSARHPDFIYKYYGTYGSCEVWGIFDIWPSNPSTKELGRLQAFSFSSENGRPNLTAEVRIGNVKAPYHFQSDEDSGVLFPPEEGMDKLRKEIVAYNNRKAEVLAIANSISLSN